MWLGAWTQTTGYFATGRCVSPTIWMITKKIGKNILVSRINLKKMNLDTFIQMLDLTAHLHPRPRLQPSLFKTHFCVSIDIYGVSQNNIATYLLASWINHNAYISSCSPIDMTTNDMVDLRVDSPSY